MGLREALGKRVIGESSPMRVVDADRLALLEAAVDESARLRRERDLAGWRAVADVENGDQDLPYEDRLAMVREARVAWQRDPLGGAAVDLMNRFVFGRGVPKPRARDTKVQEVLDRVWDDPDNQAILTSTQAQVALGTDLACQSNLFVAFFDDGDDGAVKVGLVPHDSVRNVVRHPANKQRLLYFVTSRQESTWDFSQHRLVASTEPPKTRYFAHWSLALSADEAKKAGLTLPAPQKGDLAKGRVYHVALNRGSEMAFGVPEFQRILPWMSSYNAFMGARVDMMKAAASIIMQAKAKGTPSQVRRLAEQDITRRSALSAARPIPSGEPPLAPPMNASTLVTNESVEFSPMRLDSGAGAAAQDASMIRSQVSASTGWPQHYLGDGANASLASATSLELPILKAVELRQELFEGLFRALFDRAIERAIETGLLSREADPEEDDGERIGEAPSVDDEKKTGRDLGYDFAMPNPLKRALSDLVSAATNVARSFDPNNTNLELSRALLQIVLADGFEVQDAAGMVDRILPPGYVDPAVQAAQQAQQAQMAAMAGGGDQGGGEPPPDGGFEGADGDRHGEDNAYGAPKRSQAPEDVAEGDVAEAARRMPASVDVGARERMVAQAFDEQVMGTVRKALADAALEV